MAHAGAIRASATRAGCRRMARDGARGTHAFERKSGEVPTRPTGEQSGEGEGRGGAKDAGAGAGRGIGRCCGRYLRSLTATHTQVESSRVELEVPMHGGNKH